MQGYAAAQAHSGRATGSWPWTARGQGTSIQCTQFQAALLSATVQSGPGSSWAARASGQLELEGPASQPEPVTMTGSTGSESWGRSDVGKAVGINLVMHSVPGPGGRHYHMDRLRGRWPGDTMHSVPESARPRRWANRFKFTVHPTRSLGWILCLQCQADSSSPDDACCRAFSALLAGLPEADNVFRICCMR
jgi:hypothetical protein